MFTIKTLNAISPVGLAKLNKNLFDVSVDTDVPDGILVRSADLLNTTFNDNLLTIARVHQLHKSIRQMLGEARRGIVSQQVLMCKPRARFINVTTEETSTGIDSMEQMMGQ